jgi:hypothetical protein
MEDLSLRYGRLSLKTELSKIDNLGEEGLYWLLSSKVNVEIGVKLVIRQLNANQSTQVKKAMRLFVTIERNRSICSPIVLS